MTSLVLNNWGLDYLTGNYLQIVSWGDFDIPYKLSLEETGIPYKLSHEEILTFRTNCLMRRQFACNVKFCFLWKIKKCFRLLASMLSDCLGQTWYCYKVKSSIQWQHLFPKTLPLKLICYYTEYLMSRLICKKVWFCSYFLIEHIFWIFVRIASRRQFKQISKT